LIPGVLSLQVAKGLSLSDIVTYVHELVLQARFSPLVHVSLSCKQLPQTDCNCFLKVLGQILEKLSEMEYRLTFGVNERIQLAAFVGVFQLAQEAVMQEDAASRK